MVLTVNSILLFNLNTFYYKTRHVLTLYSMFQMLQSVTVFYKIKHPTKQKNSNNNRNNHKMNNQNNGNTGG